MTESSLIGFSRGTASDATFNAINPATGEISDLSFCHASGEDVAKACELASSASIEMASLSGAQKAGFLRDLADRIDGLVDQLVVTMTEETGLPARIWRLRASSPWPVSFDQSSLSFHPFSRPRDLHARPPRLWKNDGRTPGTPCACESKQPCRLSSREPSSRLMST